MDKKVLVIFSKKNNKAKVCNGLYIGDTIPCHKEDRGSMADFLRDIKRSNPTIITDNGTIYGCECWWGGREAALKVLKDCELEYITVEEYFKNNRKDVKNGRQ